MKRLRLIALSSVVLILSVSLLTKIFIIDAAPQPTSFPTGQVTITGQIVPSVNPRMLRDDGLILEKAGRPRDRRIIGYENPFEYFLYDAQNTEIRLSFTDAGLANLRQQYVPNRDFAPEIWRSHPEYVATTALWQDWAGKWVTITGSYDDKQVFQVTSLMVATPPASQFATSTTNRRDELVEMIALVGDFPELPESIYPYTFLILDAIRDDGMPFKIMVYTENYSSWTKSAIPFSLFRT
ncbi:MAG: hypothetical protein KF716_33090 [Anaerolineae bacterium]|nr:hypothetical protein [Anaerolineae bacterium]